MIDTLRQQPTAMSSRLSASQTQHPMVISQDLLRKQEPRAQLCFSMAGQWTAVCGPKVFLKQLHRLERYQRHCSMRDTMSGLQICGALSTRALTQNLTLMVMIRQQAQPLTGTSILMSLPWKTSRRISTRF